VPPSPQDPDDAPRRPWPARRAPLPLFDPARAPPGAPWESVQLAAAEAALAAARQANSPIDAWEAGCLILRCGFVCGGRGVWGGGARGAEPHKGCVHQAVGSQRLAPLWICHLACP
jgi:hypothetical protein